MLTNPQVINTIACGFISVIFEFTNTTVQFSSHIFPIPKRGHGKNYPSVIQVPHSSSILSSLNLIIPASGVKVNSPKYTSSAI